MNLPAFRRFSRRRSRWCLRRRSYRPRFEQLEDRILLATCHDLNPDTVANRCTQIDITGGHLPTDIIAGEAFYRIRNNKELRRQTQPGLQIFQFTGNIEVYIHIEDLGGAHRIGP